MDTRRREKRQRRRGRGNLFGEGDNRIGYEGLGKNQPHICLSKAQRG